MILLSYYNSGEPVFAVAKDNINCIISTIMTDYIGKVGLCRETFDSTLVSYDNGGINVHSYNLNVKITQKDPVEGFKEIAKDFEEAYIFDTYDFYICQNGTLKRLEKNDYTMQKCNNCGKTFFGKDMVEGLCLDCFLAVGIDNILKSINEQYTEYESFSRVYEAILQFEKKISEHCRLTNDMKEKVKDIIKNFLYKEKIPEKYHNAIIGGFAA